MAHAECLTKVRLKKGLFMEVWLVLKEPRGMLGTHSESEAATTQRYSGARRQKGRSSSVAACGFRVCSPAEPQQSRCEPLFHPFCPLSDLLSVPPSGPNQPEARGQRGL